MVSAPEELNFKFSFVLSNLNLNNYTWLAATILDSAVWSLILICNHPGEERERERLQKFHGLGLEAKYRSSSLSPTFLWPECSHLAALYSSEGSLGVCQEEGGVGLVRI